MSSQIAAERKNYYLELELAQRGDLNLTKWLLWFFGCLERAIDGANETLSNVLVKAEMWERINRQPVNNRQRLVLNRMFDGFGGFLNASK